MDSIQSTTTIPLAKKCSKCDSVYSDPAKWFYRNKNTPDGLRAECKSCFYKMVGKPPSPKIGLPDGFKRCGSGNKCLTPGGPVLPATEEFFSREMTKRVNDGFRGRCKMCRAIELSAYNKQYGERAEVKERAKKYRHDHREEINRRKYQHRRDHPEVERVKRQRRTAREHSVPATFTKDDWNFALEYFHGACAYCGRGARLFDYYQGLHQEHHVPLVSGGAYSPSNIIPACQDCNLKKNDRDPHEWIIERFGKRQAKVVEERVGIFFAVARQDDSANVPFVRKSRSEKAQARRDAIAANPPTHKCCSRKDKCANPSGPIQPATDEYFNRKPISLDGLSRECRECNKSMCRERHRKQHPIPRVNPRKKIEDYLDAHPDLSGTSIRQHCIAAIGNDNSQSLFTEILKERNISRPIGRKKQLSRRKSTLYDGLQEVDGLISITDAALRAAVSYTTLSSAAKNGKIKARNLKSHWFIYASDIERWKQEDYRKHIGDGTT